MTYVLSKDDAPQAPSVRGPSKSLDIVASTTPAESAVAVSSRLFASSPAVAVVAADDPAALELGIRTAKTLAAPVLVDGPTTAAEVKRLDADNVLTFGATGSYDNDHAVTKATAGKETARVRKTYDTLSTAKRDIFVMTASTTLDAAAVATATNAGATVVELPGGDPRADPKVAGAIAEAQGASDRARSSVR